jgi:hypothetical protein
MKSKIMLHVFIHNKRKFELLEVSYVVWYKEASRNKCAEDPYAKNRILTSMFTRLLSSRWYADLQVVTIGI